VRRQKSRLRQRRPGRQLAISLRGINSDATARGAIDVDDGLDAPGGGVSNKGGPDTGVLGGVVGFSEGCLGGNTSNLRRGGHGASAVGLNVRTDCVLAGARGGATLLCARAISSGGCVPYSGDAGRPDDGSASFDVRVLRRDLGHARGPSGSRGSNPNAGGHGRGEGFSAVNGKFQARDIDLLAAVGGGCIDAYNLGDDDLGTALGGSSLGSDNIIVGGSSNTDALLGNVIPLGDGSTTDRVGKDDDLSTGDLSGTTDWRWPMSGRSGRHRLGHRRPSKGGGLRASSDEDKVLGECGMCSGTERLGRDGPDGSMVSPGVLAGGILAGESGRKGLNIGVHAETNLSSWRQHPRHRQRRPQRPRRSATGSSNDMQVQIGGDVCMGSDSGNQVQHTGLGIRRAHA
jgi:hypothetical protein